VDHFRQNKTRLNILGRRILRKCCGPVKDGVWWRRYNYELYELRKEPDIAVT
jgi:hypothetical protein